MAVIKTEPNPPTGPYPLEVTFNAANSRGGDIVAYNWDFGDGTTASGVQVSHTFEERGTYTVELVVVDDASRTARAEREVTVRSQAPVAQFVLHPHHGVLMVGDVMTVDASGSFHPDDGQEVVEYEWSFGDGTIVTLSDPETSHVYEAPGSYNVVLRVIDGDGNHSSPAQRRIEVRVGCPGCGL